MGLERSDSHRHAFATLTPENYGTVIAQCTVLHIAFA